MSSACNFEGCTVGETGACALERDPATCEHAVKIVFEHHGGHAMGADDRDGIGSSVLPQPEQSATFPPSHTLGPEVVSNLMASRYVTVVGILGDPDSGKTACLASIYLLLSNAMLKGWAFADSKSLMGFEEIVRGARDWNEGSPPDQMTMHTEMTDERRAGFLHLRLVRQSDGRRVDLALPDLPGEWTTKLVTTAQAERFEFMKAASVIWIVLDGRALADKERRQGIISRAGQLADRLTTMFVDRLPRVLIVISHRDGGAVAETVASRLLSELRRKGVEAAIVPVAPFSDDEAMRAGFGISDLIDATSGSSMNAPDFWPDKAPVENQRSFVSHRREQ
jgi:hypothetical protein